MQGSPTVPLCPPKACSLTLNLILPLTAQCTYLFHVSHAALFVIAQYGMAWLDRAARDFVQAADGHLMAYKVCRA